MKKLTEKEIKAGGKAMPKILKEIKDTLIGATLESVVKVNSPPQLGLSFTNEKLDEPILVFADADDERNHAGAWCVVEGRKNKVVRSVLLTDLPLTKDCSITSFGYYPYNDYSVMPVITLTDKAGSTLVLGALSDEEGNRGGVFSIENCLVSIVACQFNH